MRQPAIRRRIFYCLHWYVTWPSVVAYTPWLRDATASSGIGKFSGMANRKAFGYAGLHRVEADALKEGTAALQEFLALLKRERTVR